MTTTRTAAIKRKEGSLRRAMRLSPDERHGQLLSCAIKAFAAHGLATANHAMVAAAAQVSVPTVFSYFRTREALVDAVLSEVERFFMTIFASANDAVEPADRTLMELSQTLTRSLHASHADYSRILREWSVSVRSEIWPRYLRLYRRMTRVFSRVIERGQREGSFRSDVDPNDEAVILYAVSTALFQMMETRATPEQLDRFRRAAIQSVLLQPEAQGGSRAGARSAAKRRTVRAAPSPR